MRLEDDVTSPEPENTRRQLSVTLRVAKVSRARLIRALAPHQDRGILCLIWRDDPRLRLPAFGEGAVRSSPSCTKGTSGMRTTARHGTKMVKQFFRDSLVYLIPAGLSQGLAFVTFPLYAHHFTPQQYGVLDLLILAGMLIGWTVALEIYQAVGRFVAGEKNLDLARTYSSTGLWYAVASYGVFLAFSEGLAVPISHLLLGPTTSVTLLRFALPLMCLQGLVALVQAQLRWQLRPIAFAIGSVLLTVCTLVSSIVLVFGAGLELEGAILGQLVGMCVCLAYSLAATRGTFGFRFDWAKLKEMISFSAPLVLSSVGVFLNLYADRLVIQHTRSIQELGIYGVGYRLATVITLLLYGFQGAALPLILTRKDDPSTPRDLARILRIFTALALTLFVVLTIFASPAIRLLAAPPFQPATSVVPFLVLSVLFANMYIFAPGLSVAKKTKPMAVTTLLAGAANLALALLLVPPFGIVGAGIATSTTSCAWFVALMVLSQRYYPAPHDWPRLVLAFTSLLAFVAISLALLPSSRTHALSAGTLAVRTVLVLTGSALSVGLALDRATMTAALSVLSTTSAAIGRRALPNRRAHVGQRT